MREVPLTRGMTAFIDNEDADLVFKFSWRVVDNKHNHLLYAATGESTIRMHRMILNAPKGVLVDHLNGNTLDNQRSNIRLATGSQSNRNRRKFRNCSSQFRGVYRLIGSRLWTSQIWYADAPKKIGSFANEEEAAKAYDQEAIRLFGKDAKLNFPR